MTGFFQLKTGLRLILASTSPRRKTLLESLGLPFTIFAPKAREPLPEPGERAPDFARRAALAKGRSCARELSPWPGGETLILAADTIVSLGGEILGKPRHTREALAMLQKLNGKCHTVFTAFHLAIPDNPQKLDILEASQSQVCFGQWPNEVLAAYAQCGEPLDKAGSYALQGRGAFLVERVEGSWTNVVGLPLAPIVGILLQNGLIAPRPVDKSFMPEAD